MVNKKQIEKILEQVVENVHTSYILSGHKKHSASDREKIKKAAERLKDII